MADSRNTYHMALTMMNQIEDELYAALMIANQHLDLNTGDEDWAVEIRKAYAHAMEAVWMLEERKAELTA